jgi:O-antigen/teichoic acid export membrane protein
LRLLWLSLAGAGLALCAIWLLAPPESHIGLWALLPFLLSAVLVIAAAHHLAHRYHHGRHRKPLAGPRPGARLPR